MGNQNSIIQGVDWNAVALRVKKEQVNRESYTPTISTFRWWARRPHALIGAILDEAVRIGGDGLTVSDPFSGGGTVALEAARRGIPLYAQDLYSWPMFGLYTALTQGEPEAFLGAASALLEQMEPYRAAYRLDNGRELTHILRVRTGTCPSCETMLYLFPNLLVSLVSRRSSETRGYFGCPKCGGVTCKDRECRLFECEDCRTKWEFDSWKLTKRNPVPCPTCKTEVTYASVVAKPPQWKVVLVQERNKGQRFLRPVESGDPVLSEHGNGRIDRITVPLKDGIETARLIKDGFKTWGDLYPYRQALIIVNALNTVRDMDVDNSSKNRLLLAVIGCAEMAGYLCRWDRFHLKTFEMLANHRYSYNTLAVETNLLSPFGRGTLPRRLKAQARALEWLTKGRYPDQLELVRGGDDGPIRITHGKAVLAVGSSHRQRLEKNSVSLILTDPPYYDDVQYGELARVFHFWLEFVTDEIMADEALEAVPNRIRQVDAENYACQIGRCFTECLRTLKADGRIIFSFQSRKVVAWQALAQALIHANMRIQAMSVCLAENAGDHAKKGKKAFLHDLILECTYNNGAAGSQIPNVRENDGNEQERNLIAAGLALVDAIQSNQADDFQSNFNAHLHQVSGQETWIN